MVEGESHWKENQKKPMASMARNPARVLEIIFKNKEKSPCPSPAVQAGCLDEVQHLV